MKKIYPCVRVQQTTNAKDLLLFSASAVDIDEWVGIPQRISLGAAETAGFQRTVSPKREQALRKFFSDPHNIIQNPLLCAIRQKPGAQVTFVPDAGNPSIGQVVIEFEDYSKLSTLDLLRNVRASLESRSLALVSRARPEELVADLQRQTARSESETFFDVSEATDDYDADDSTAADDGVETAGNESAEEALFDESQITEFWDHLRAREIIAEKISDLAVADEVFGFSRAMLESYLRPVILVDGQHRITGALLAARDAVDKSSAALDMVVKGADASTTRRLLIDQVAKRLPISLLMNESPAEHVFQYVVVNQKATPVPKALLGTIISTSLVAGELESIATRLEEASIQLEGSRTISILSRDPKSPFVNLVAKGMDDEGNNRLPWSVLGSLTELFRNLSNGRYYHDPFDHADTWRVHHLEKSKIISDWQSKGYGSAYEYWRDLNGPWMHVFKAFWTRTRDLLASCDNKSAKNYWGNPRESNIFNKPSLHILAADFFCFLRETKSTIDSFEQIDALVDDWLEYASKQYFSRDWKLAGVKKDSVGIRKQWSRLWANHRREGGAPPAPNLFSNIYKA